MTPTVEPGRSHDAPAAPTGAAAAKANAGVRTGLLAAFLTLAATLGLFLVDRSVVPAVGWSIPFWGVGLIAFASGFLVFDVEFRRETYTFTFSELVLVVGLFFAAPAHLVAGRVLGEAAYLVGRERQRPRKLVMNLAAVFAETVVLLLVQQALLRSMDARRPIAWGVALVAVVAAELVGYAAIALAVRWHGGPITLWSIIRIGLVTAPANTSLALVACVLLEVEPWAVPLLGCVAVFMVVMYRSYSALRQRHESLALLYDFTHLVSGVREPDEVLDAMLTEAKDLLRAERAEFWLALPADGMHRRHVVDDAEHRRELATLPPALAELAGRLAGRRDAVLLARGTADPLLAAVLGELGATDALVAPVVEGDDPVGFVVVVNRLSEMYSFVGQDARMFATLASHAGVALQNGRLIARLHEQARQREHEALHDPLTGLPNRAMFGRRLTARLADAHREVAIALMDLDGFKEINDTLGHQAGDQVLIEIARRLRVTLPDEVLAVRLGGDEFALLAGPGIGHTRMEALCHAVRDAVAEPMQIEHLTVTMGVSVGIAVAPMDGDDADTLVRRADVAMYTAKAGQHGGVCFYDPDRDENTPRRLALAHDLRLAIAAGQVEIVFQPKIALDDGRMTGVECLSRWEHPTLGTIPPDEFVPLAEKTGAIGDLTTWMLGRACEHAARWRTAGRDWNVAVNISVRNLLDSELVTTLVELLAVHDLDAAALTFEITESHVMSDAVRTTRVLEDLSAIGVRLSIDDFGTGYSSLAYLQRLPVDEMKIDKSFVADLATDRDAEAIVRSVLDLARTFGLWVVAEGVEDDATVVRLRALGCDEAQGYRFAVPMSASAVEAFADERDRGRRAVDALVAMR